MTNPTALDRVIDLGLRIARLRAELHEAESELQSFVTGGKTVVERSVPAGHRHVMPGRTMHGSIAERVRLYLIANPGKGIAIGEIIAAHPDQDAATIRSTVHRLASGGLPGFQAVARGYYRFDQVKPMADQAVARS